MKTNQYRSHSIAAALAATFVTTVLVSSLVESFEPAQLLRIEGQASETVIALERRPAAAGRQTAEESPEERSPPRSPGPLPLAAGARAPRRGAGGRDPVPAGLC